MKEFFFLFINFTIYLDKSVWHLDRTENSVRGQHLQTFDGNFASKNTLYNLKRDVQVLVFLVYSSVL